MEPISETKGLRYESILSSLDMLDGAKELSQLAERIALKLKGSLKEGRNKAD